MIGIYVLVFYRIVIYSGTIFFCVSAETGSTTTASKPPSKGFDLDAVGSISGVPVYEYDIESIKMEDKPWRKPGMYVCMFVCMFVCVFVCVIG